MTVIALTAILLSAIFSTYVTTTDARTPTARQTPTTQPLCILWTEKPSTYSDGGTSYSMYTATSLCQKICVGRNNCTAFDFDSSPGKTNCTLHFNADDLLPIHTHNDKQNSTQYIIVNRFCSTTVPSTTTTTTTTTQSLLTVIPLSTIPTALNTTYTDGALNATKAKNNNKSVAVGVGVGVGVGGFFLLLIIIFVVIVTCRLRRRKKDNTDCSDGCKRSKRATKRVVDNAYATADELPRSSAVKSASTSADLSSSVESSSALKPPPTPPPPRTSLSPAATQPASPVPPPPAPPLKPPRSHTADKPSVVVRRSAKIVRQDCDSVVPSDWNKELHTYTHHIPDANQSTVRHQTSFSNVAAVNTTYDELQFGSLNRVNRPGDKCVSVYDDIAAPRQPISEYEAVNAATVGQLNMQYAQLAVTLNAQPKKPTKA